MDPPYDIRVFRPLGKFLRDSNLCTGTSTRECYTCSEAYARVVEAVKEGRLPSSLAVFSCRRVRGRDTAAPLSLGLIWPRDNGQGHYS